MTNTTTPPPNDLSLFFGKPGRGIHFHVFGIAIVDLLLTILAAYYISKSTQYSFIFVLMVLLVLSVIVHKIFGVHTTLSNMF
jgi:hypothetical protein